MLIGEFDDIYTVGCPVQDLFSLCSYIIVKIYISLLMSCGFVYVFWKPINAECGPKIGSEQPCWTMGLYHICVTHLN